MKDIILVKFGGSIITDKHRAFHARRSVIRRLAQEIKSALKERPFHIVVGHGSGSFGHTIAARYKMQQGLTRKESVKGLSLTSDAAITLHRIVMENLLEAGLPVFSFAPASFILSERKKEKEVFLTPILKTIEAGLIPVVYGDVVLDLAQGCAIFSADRTIGILASFLKKRFKSIKVISCVNTDGVYDEEGNTIPVITLASFVGFQKSIKKSDAVDVTGGMLQKVKESLDIASVSGIETLIINGRIPGNLKKALLLEDVEGTLIRK